MGRGVPWFKWVRWLTLIGGTFAPIQRAAIGEGRAGTHRGIVHPGACEREAAELVGEKAIRVRRSVRTPQKSARFRPDYPDLLPAFEPLLVGGKPAPFCITVTVTIDWR